MNGAGSVWVREKQRAYLQGVFQKTHKNKLEVHVEKTMYFCRRKCYCFGKYLKSLSGQI